MACHSSSVMNGMNGWSRTRIWSSTQPAHRAGFLAAFFAALQDRLDEFEIPVAEAAPDELVDRVRRPVEPVIGQREVDRLYRLHRFGDDPLVDREAGVRCLQRGRCADAVGLGEARRVPQLGREVAIALDRRSSILMSRPWLSIAAMKKRSASAPYWSIRPSGSTVLPFDFDIFEPSAARTRPWRYSVLKGTSSMKCMPCIIIRASQKNRMSKPEISTSLG